jgi:hypothetical protein
MRTGSAKQLLLALFVTATGCGAMDAESTAPDSSARSDGREPRRPGAKRLVVERSVETSAGALLDEFMERVAKYQDICAIGGGTMERSGDPVIKRCGASSCSVTVSVTCDESQPGMDVFPGVRSRSLPGKHLSAVTARERLQVWLVPAYGDRTSYDWRVYAIWKNGDPPTPVRIGKINDDVVHFDDPFHTTAAQAWIAPVLSDLSGLVVVVRRATVNYDDAENVSDCFDAVEEDGVLELKAIEPRSPATQLRGRKARCYKP